MKARPATVQSVVSVWHGLSRSRRPLSSRDAVSRGESPHNGDCGGVWQGPIRLSWLGVMAGWRCPEADASSRWLIVIRTDLFLPTPSMIAVLCAARAIRWRNLRS